MYLTFQRPLVKVLVVALIAFALSACSNTANQFSLSDPPTVLDKQFGSAVAKMIELQRRPVTTNKPLAGYQLEGWEAEKILDSYNGVRPES